MPYRIKEFDGLALPEFIERGQSQSMGTGVAQTDFVQMPGGGFYDNYGDDDSQPSLDPIVKMCVLHAVSGSTVRAQVDALRAKIGKRGVLEVLFHDAVERWQYARLMRMRMVRPFNTAYSWLPVQLEFMPAANYWYQGTMQTTTETFAVSTGTQHTVTVNNAGNVKDRNVLLEYEVPSASMTGIHFRNYTTSQNISIASLTLAVGDLLRFHCGERWARHIKAAVNIAAIGRVGNTVTVDTAAVHGLSAGDPIWIDGTAYFDGYWTVDTIYDTDSFGIEVAPTWYTPDGTENTGTMSEVAYLYSTTTITDKAGWMYLQPGDNEIALICIGEDLDGGTFTAYHYDTYA